MGFLVQGVKSGLCRRLRAGEDNGRVKCHARHCKPPCPVFFENVHCVVCVAVNATSVMTGHREKSEDVAA